MSSVKARLTITLKADDVTVAEVEDSRLWQRVLTAIHGDKPSPIDEESDEEVLDPLAPAPPSPPQGRQGKTALDRFAQEVGLEVPVIEGACSPTTEPPFMHLNSHNWEAMRKQVPVRGPTAMSPIVAVATLLALWFRSAGLGNPTQAQAQLILGAIGTPDRNPSRGVRRATWLMPRAGGQIQLNPAQISEAVKVAKAFCSKNWGTMAKGKSE